MQRIVSLIKTVSSLSSYVAGRSAVVSSVHNERLLLLTPQTPMFDSVCGFKVKGRVRRRCKSCYFVVRDSRWYVICPKFPRHKQMAMKPKPHNTWILTQASQSPVRPW